VIIIAVGPQAQNCKVSENFGLSFFFSFSPRGLLPAGMCEVHQHLVKTSVGWFFIFMKKLRFCFLKVN
jgi:hypothetical protein